MDTYYPVTDDGKVQFYDYGCHQEVTADGLTTDSAVAAQLLSYGLLRTGDAKKKSQPARMLIAEPFTDGVATDVEAVTYNPADAAAPNAVPLSPDADSVDVEAQSHRDPADQTNPPKGD